MNVNEEEKLADEERRGGQGQVIHKILPPMNMVKICFSTTAVNVNIQQGIITNNKSAPACEVLSD